MHSGSRFTLRALLLLGLVSALFLAACSSDDGPAAPDREPAYTAEEVEAMIVQPQTDRKTVLDDLIGGGMSQMAAADSVVQLFLADPNVATAEADSHGIGVLYANGMVGGIVWDPQDAPEQPGPELLRHDTPLGATAAGKATPKEAVFLNSHYSDRTAYADPIRDNYGNLLEDAGYGVLNVFLDDDVTLEQYTQLGGHRIVHIYSHGCAWPTKENLQEVYLLSGESFSLDTYTTYWEEVEDGKLALMLWGGEGNKFLVSPQFISKHNNFGSDTLIYGGFCFSFLGSWPEMFAMEGAGGYFGFDWSVYTSYNAAWNRDLIALLLDTSADPPNTVNDWYNNDMVKWYRDTGADRIVHINYQGEQMLTLLDDPHPECSETVIEHGDGYVMGNATVLYGGVPQAEVPVQIVYRKIHCDGHLGSVGPYSGETDLNGFYNPGMVGVFTLNNSQDLVVVRATVNGQQQEKIYRVSAFGGMNGGSLFFPLVAEFVFNF